MNINLPSTSEVTGILEKIGKTAGFPIGFLYGATAQTPVVFTTADFEQRIVDAIAEVSGVHLTLNGHTSTYVQVFKPTGFLNKGFWGYLGVWGYDALGLPFGRVVKNMLGNFLIGYSVGGFFDPPVPQPGTGYYTGPSQFSRTGGFSSQVGSRVSAYGNLSGSSVTATVPAFTSGGAAF